MDNSDICYDNGHTNPHLHALCVVGLCQIVSWKIKIPFNRLLVCILSHSEPVQIVSDVFFFKSSPKNTHTKIALLPWWYSRLNSPSTKFCSLSDSITARCDLNSWQYIWGQHHDSMVSQAQTECQTCQTCHIHIMSAFQVLWMTDSIIQKLMTGK